MVRSGGGGRFGVYFCVLERELTDLLMDLMLGRRKGKSKMNPRLLAWAARRIVMPFNKL